jgi:RNA polymerase sigma factor for flagellar operon FliA
VLRGKDGEHEAGHQKGRRKILVAEQLGCKVSSETQGTPAARAAVDRNGLAEAYRSYARAIAAEVAQKCGTLVERAELESAADLGLVEAASAYDPSRGVQFTTFSYYRIRGAVYDFLRKVGMRPSIFEVAANEYLRDVSSGTPPGNAEQECEELRNVGGSLATCHLLSLEVVTRQIADTSEASPEEQVLQQERRATLHKALAQLPARKRQVLEDYYFKGMSLDEIGRGLGLSRSRVSRIHAKCLEQIRTIMLELNSRRGESSGPPKPGGAESGSGEGNAKLSGRPRQLFAAPFDKQSVRP